MRSTCGIFALLALFHLPALAAQMLTEVISTRRDAAELATILRPLVPPPGSLNSFRNQLIIKTSAVNLAEIHDLLKKLDKAPENLLITVRFSDDAQVRRDLAQAHARLLSGDPALAGSRTQPGGGVSAGVRGAEVNAGLRVQRSVSTHSGNEVHALRVLEGQQAFIRTGQSVPLAEEQVTVTGFGVNTSHSIRFEEFGSGFYVLPHLNGDRVTLEISTQRRHLNGSSNAINSARVQGTATHISGRLGRWMEIAGVNSAAHRRALGSANSRVRTTREDNSIYVKIERLGS